MSAIEIYNINKNNCNGVLSRLYKERDRISQNIDRCISVGADTTYLENSYNKLCDHIYEICKWRSENPGCLLEGDPGFSYI